MIVKTYSRQCLIAVSVFVLTAGFVFTGCSEDEDTSSCQFGAERSFPCGSVPGSSQPQTCVDGQWYSTSFCETPSGERDPADDFGTNENCEDGATRAATCGEGDRGLQPERCDNGTWVPTNACSFGPGNNPNPDASSDTDGDDGGDTITSDCTSYETLPTSISEETTLDGCYESDESVTISGRVTVTPGSELLFGENTKLTIDESGSLNAVGTADQPILIAGKRSIAGIWYGVVFDASDRIDNHLSYVTIRDAGKDGGASLDLYACCGDKVSVAIDHTTITNGAGFGLQTDSDTELPNFKSNTLTGNKKGAARIHPRMMGFLDADSDYSGNDTDIVEVYGGEVTTPIVVSAINVPYRITEDVGFTGFDTEVTIDAGVTFEFAESRAFVVAEEAVLRAEGTAEKPIVFKGVESSPGFWKYIKIDASDRTDNLLRHVNIQDAGSEGAALSLTACCGDTTTLNMEHVSFDVSGSIMAIAIDDTSLPTCTDVNITADQITGSGKADAVAACGL